MMKIKHHRVNGRQNMRKNKLDLKSD